MTTDPGLDATQAAALRYRLDVALNRVNEMERERDELLDLREETERLRAALRRIRDAAEAGATHEHLLGVIADEDAQGMIEEAKP